jgi:hypothetical protein
MNNHLALTLRSIMDGELFHRRRIKVQKSLDGFFEALRGVGAGGKQKLSAHFQMPEIAHVIL